jgi:hypothetical protein
MDFDCRDNHWEDRALQTWGGRVQDQAHGIVPIGLPLPPGIEPIEIIKRGEDGDPPVLRNSRFYHMAGLRIIDGVARDSGGDEVDMENVLSTHTFYNFREGKWLTARQIDIEELIEEGLAPENRIIYISDSETMPDALDAVIRIKNGERLPVGGLTIATDNPLYVWGDFNTIEPQPSSVLSDAFNILSNQWEDENSDQPLDQRRASDTTVRVGVCSGTLDTTPGNYNGGIENFPRLLEDWSWRRLTYCGSLVSLWLNEWATGKWDYGDPYYISPIRDWSFDVTFYDPDLLPPGSPNILNYEDGQWIVEP